MNVDPDIMACISRENTNVAVRIEIEYYSVAYFERITEFDAL